MENPTVPGMDPRSGHGPASVIPDEIKRWSWGAFLLSWIWGIGNRVWLSFLVFVPIVNIVAPFVLGAKGNEYAWRAKSWPSVDEFHKTQRKWAIGGLIVLGASLLISIGSIVFVLLFAKPVEPSAENSFDAWQEEFDREYGSESESDVSWMDEDPAWITYSPDDQAFSVELPYEPESESGSYETEEEGFVQTTILRADEGTSVYFVAIEEFEEPRPEAASAEEAEALLRSSLASVEEALEGASVISTESTTVLGYPALRYTMFVGTERTEEGVLILKEDRIYTVAAEYDMAQRPEAFETYQSSFTLR